MAGDDEATTTAADEGTDDAATAGDEDEESGSATDSESDDTEAADTADGSGGFDVESAEERLQEVENQIEEGRRGLADLEEELDPEPEGPPIARGEGAANAPPG